LENPLAEPNEPIEALPLIMKRKLLGIGIPALCIPFFFINAYLSFVLLSHGTPPNSADFIGSIIVTLVSIGVGFFLPWWTPVYQSTYIFEPSGVRINRFLRSSILLPYKSLVRAEVYTREPGDVSADAINYTKESADVLKKSGLGFVDYTNSEANIVLLVSGTKIYMISPAKPKAFLKSLKRRAPKLTAKIVELNAKGKNIQELG
jgi:hypothetical protein